MKTLMLMVTLASAHLIRGAANVNAVDVNAGAFEAAQRKLEGTCTLTTETHYFEVSIRIQPDGTQNQYGECAVQDQVVLGHDLNTMLLDYVRYEPLTPCRTSTLLLYMHLTYYSFLQTGNWRRWFRRQRHVPCWGVSPARHDFRWHFPCAQVQTTT